MQATIQTKITDEKSVANLEIICEELSQLRSRLLRDILSKKDANALKSEYIKEHGMTAHQYNSLSSELRGLIKSARELNQLNIRNIKAQIKSQKQQLKKLSKQLQKLSSNEKDQEETQRAKTSLKYRIHQKKRKLSRTKDRLEKLNPKRVSICLGSKKLFRAQYNLAANKYKNHGEWLLSWRKKRGNRIFYIGSKDETFGNQNCQLIGNRLQVRVLPRLEKQLGQYISIPIEFSYGQDLIDYALSKPQAINYRFVRKEKGWYVFLTTQRPPVKLRTQKRLGVIGVDVNKAHLAWAETNRHGNLIGFDTISTPIQDRNSNQVSATFGEAIKIIVEYAAKQQKPIVVEKLDFTGKKNKFAQYGKRYRRMLSHFAYAKFYKMICSKAYREGVQIIDVNPAFSSVIGKFKYSQMYGISVHIAAAFVLARRGLWFSEFLPSTTARYLAVHRYWHVWKQWKKLLAVFNRETRVGLDPRLMPSRKLGPSQHLVC